MFDKRSGDNVKKCTHGVHVINFVFVLLLHHVNMMLPILNCIILYVLLKYRLCPHFYPSVVSMCGAAFKNGM